MKINSVIGIRSPGLLGMVLLLQASLVSGAIAGEKSTDSGVSQDWKPTTLSEKTLGKINQAVDAAVDDTSFLVDPWLDLA